LLIDRNTWVLKPYGIDRARRGGDVGRVGELKACGFGQGGKEKLAGLRRKQPIRRRIKVIRKGNQSKK